MARRSGKRLTTEQAMGLLAVLFITAVGTLFQQCNPRTQPPREQPQARTDTAPAASDNRDPQVHLALGNPSNARTDEGQANNYLITRPQFAASYNDRDATAEDNRAVFTMLNIVPQTGDNNRGPWEKLESYCRTLVRKGNELYIIAGVAGEQGRLPRGNVTIPASTWKVIVVLPRDDRGDDAARVRRDTRVIAVDMPNINGIKEDSWRRFRTSVDAIEQVTGYDLLPRVNQTVQAEIERRVDEEP
jgi:DNA/RNA endonuclease G (NUC1)